jgi:hypothetical protein
MSMQIQLGPKAFSFTSFQQWVDKAQGWFVTRLPKRAREGKRYLCIDAVGRVCLVGADFMRARDEGTFPIVVFLIDSDTPAASTALTGASKGSEMTEYAYGHCEENRKPGGCQLHNLHCGYPDCDRRALTGAQPAPAAPSGEDVQQMLFDIRGAMLRYGTACRKDDEDGIRSSTTEACELLDRLAALAAPAAQPADSAMEVLRELVRLEELLDARRAEASAARRRQMTDEYETTKRAAWDRARALTAASKAEDK